MSMKTRESAVLPDALDPLMSARGLVELLERCVPRPLPKPGESQDELMFLSGQRHLVEMLLLRLEDR